MQPEAAGWFNDAMIEVASRGPEWLQLEGEVVTYDREQEEDSFKKFCSAVSLGTTLVLDMSWSYWERASDLVESFGAAVLGGEVGEGIYILKPLLNLLSYKNATDAVLIFEKEQVMEHYLYKILGSSVLRILAIFDFKGRIEQIRNLRPIPNYYIIIGRTPFLQDTYKMMVASNLVTLPDRWILASTDLVTSTLDVSVLMDNTTIITLVPETACTLQDISSPCSDEIDIDQMNAIVMKKIVMGIVQSVWNSGIPDKMITVNCETAPPTLTTELIGSRRKFILEVLNNLMKNTTTLYINLQKPSVLLRAGVTATVGGRTGLREAARWYTDEPLQPSKTANITSPRRFFRVGIATSVPWTYPVRDASGNYILDSNGDLLYEGYCIDLIAKLAEVMNFDYDLVVPKSGKFGSKLPNGSWDGLIGDLASGDTDLAVAAIVMTSQREEVVDFVAPYFDQTGISIVIRKPVRKTSLFKFMTVLRTEVWVSIVGALVCTAILLTILDKYSPYSARNNKEAYPYPCREFTLKESLWFALTSFTPQGGGEAPKSLSSRTLVAAYWLFVVLMLATFTANLAAFLTVERMQTPVASLEQLARQSRINYTVVEGSMAHRYFINMKHAEDTLYRVWKEITLNASSDELQYQVWDYPVKEQYGHILLAINASIPLSTADEGFRKVDERSEADFAFIHDSSEIKYRVKKNCNLTMVGEVFGERPYAVAVQQGSRLQEELSRAVLQLQKDRFLDDLTSKYWNSSCEESEDSEGITLDSLGGVFIATVFGLALAMVTLVWEIVYFKRRDRIQQATKKIAINPGKLLGEISSRVKEKKRAKDKLKKITFGDDFKTSKDKKGSKIHFINVEPKIPWNP